MKIGTAMLMLIFSVGIFTLPAEASGAGSQPGKQKSSDKGRGKNGGLWVGGQPGRRRFQGRNRITYGYKNYGQYRRTQVGNRRYRLARRYYLRDGIRISRWIRIYY